MIMQDESIYGFKQTGFSNNFQIGFVRDMPLNKKGNIALGLGLGYSFDKVVSNLNLDVDEQNKLSFFISENGQNRQTYSSLVIPLAFRWRTSSMNKTDFWRIYTGIKYKLNFNSRFNFPNGDTIKRDFIREQNSSFYVAVGYNTWNLFFEYDLNSIYLPSLALPNEMYPDVRAIRIGLIFFVL